jgi:hypothetical protein
MSGNRVLYYNEHIGSYQYRLRIRRARGDVREWFIYHPQTQTIRLAANRNLVISNPINKGVLKGQALVIRHYKTRDQSIYWDMRSGRLHNGRDMRFCVDVWGGRNADSQHTTLWTCHNGAN